MERTGLAELSRRERQIMDIVFQEGAVTVSAVRSHLSDPPSYSAVRAIMRILEEKGYLKHREERKRYIYEPAIDRGKARNSALRRVLRTFFDGRPEGMVAALMDLSAADMTEEQFRELSRLIAKARREEG